MTVTRVLRLALRITAVVAAVLLLALGVAWATGRLLVARAETEPLVGLPEGVPGRQLTIDGRPVHLVDRGAGPPLLLVHGFAGSTFDWEEHALEPLAADHRVLALDLFGMGFSARDDTLPYGFDLWAEQLRQTLDALGVERATVAGHSLGGAVATLFAARHPERVGRLVLVAPLVPYRTETTFDFFTLLQTPGAGELTLGLLDHLPALEGFSPAYHARAAAAFRLRGTRDALLRYVRHGADVRALDAALHALATPTLFVLGTEDEHVPYVAQRHAAAAVDGALVRPLEGAGHWLLRDRPGDVVDAIRG